MRQYRLGLKWHDWRETFGYKMGRYRGEASRLLGHRNIMNQTDFGYLVGISQGRVSRYEIGLTPVPVDVQERVERVMEVLRDAI